MIRKTTTEANRAFTDITKIVDNEGEVILTKHGKDRYIIMTIEKYEGRQSYENEMKEKAKEGFWVTFRDNYWKIETQNGETTLTRIDFTDGEPTYFKKVVLPEDSISYIKPNRINIEKKGKISIDAEEVWYNENPEIFELAKEAKSTKDIQEVEFTGFRMAII